MMRLIWSRFRWLVSGAALAALVAGWVLCARPAAAAAAGSLSGPGSTGGLVVVGTAGSAAGAENPDPGADANKDSWERQLERVERNRLITVVVFLGIVFSVLLFWWSWGKLHHRARKL